MEADEYAAWDQYYWGNNGGGGGSDYYSPDEAAAWNEYYNIGQGYWDDYMPAAPEDISVPGGIDLENIFPSADLFPFTPVTSADVGIPEASGSSFWDKVKNALKNLTMDAGTGSGGASGSSSGTVVPKSGTSLLESNPILVPALLLGGYLLLKKK